MRSVSRLAAWLLASALGCVLPAHATDDAAQLRPVAHSAQLTLEAATAPGGVVLRVRRVAAPATPATPAALDVTDLGVSIDGKRAPAMRRVDGSWFVPLASPAAAAERKLEVMIAHDGIRELLSGSVPPLATPAPVGAPAARREHQQLAWWILNIAIVFIAVIAISRRMS
jgi:hypothetical protein